VAKSGSTSWFRPGWLALFLLPALAYAGYSVADRWYQGYVLALEEAELRREIGDLRKENLRLQSELVHIRGDQYIEKVAREQLNLVKPGDRALVLLGPTGAPTAEPATRRDPAPPAEKPAWRRLLEPIFGR
jgi:cell division protein DivIC